MFKKGDKVVCIVDNFKFNHVPVLKDEILIVRQIEGKRILDFEGKTTDGGYHWKFLDENFISELEWDKKYNNVS